MGNFLQSNNDDNNQPSQHMNPITHTTPSDNRSNEEYVFNTADYLILLSNFASNAERIGRISINNSACLPLFLIVDIFAYAGIEPTLIHDDNHELRRGRNCNREYTSVKLRIPKYFTPYQVSFQIESKDQGKDIDTIIAINIGNYW